MEAANWVASGDFLKAVEQYVTGYCEDRKVVANGKVTSQTVRRCVEGTATWTPGDVNMAKQKGGLVHLMSTRENPYQMPAVIIGIRAWNVRNAKTVENLLTAALEGSEQVRHFEEALSKAGRIAFNVYGEQDAGYWVRYYKGVQERDKIGIPVRLGGSVTANLADNLFLFGLAEGAGGILSSAYNASYSGFGRVVQQQYPELLPSFPPIDEAVNTQFLQALAAKGVKSDAAQLTEFVETNEEISRESVVARRNWTINFDTGKATFTATALTTLDELYNQLAIGGALAVQIDGHTDSVGDPTLNHILSQQRADAVRIYLQQRNPSLFPAGRVITRGYGDTQPTAPNTTATGRAANRRVTITLGTI